MSTEGIIIEGKKYREIRCNKCRRLLGYEYVFSGRIAFDCPRCGELLVLHNFDWRHKKDTLELPKFNRKEVSS